MVGPYPLPGRPPTGGIEAVAVALVRGLRDAGVDLTLVTCTSAVAAPDVVRDDGLDLHLLPYGSSSRRSIPYLTERRHVQRTLRRLAPDVVHVQGQTQLAGAALSVGLPTVVTLHGIIYREQHIADPTASAASRVRARLRNGLNARFERTTLERARDLVIISPYVLQAVEHMTRARTHMVANPIDDDFYEIPRRPVPGEPRSRPGSGLCGAASQGSPPSWLSCWSWESADSPRQRAFGTSSTTPPAKRPA